MKKVVQQTLNGVDASITNKPDTQVISKKKERTGRTRSKESAVRKKVDILLTNLGWNTDEESPKCNVTTERAINEEQNRLIFPNEPDYILYKSNTVEPICIIETKRKGKTLDEYLKESVEKYAKPLDVTITIVTDGVFFKTWHLKAEKELTINGMPVTEILSEKLVLRFIDEGADLSTETKEIKHTRDQLMDVFEWANKVLRKEGIREGFDRFIEFANILFLKLISEMEIERETRGEKRTIEKKYCWEHFEKLDAETMLEYINGTVLPHLSTKYNHSEDVFQNKMQITNPQTLKQIVNKLTKLQGLINTESDVKGDAFEYFLKNSVTVGNDLGEYFTPRHIVKLMVDLINPQFGEKVYDPTCGTGGFIIEAFRHIKQSCKLTDANMKILKEQTIYAGELTNTSRIAKMNMILAGDGHTNIKQMDCLANKIENEYDVVLANIPYGQTTNYGSLYDVPIGHGGNADCVFIQHIILSLNDTGRCAVIIPEGFLFRGGADKKTRELIVEQNNLQAVISLPPKMFLPYTDAKTNILIFEKGSITKKVWFYDLKADGFELSMTRKPIPENDIPDLINKWSNKTDSPKSMIIDAKTIKDNNYDLVFSTYKPIEDMQLKGLSKFSTFLTPSVEKITLEDDMTYTQITVKMNGKGAVTRQKIKGNKIGTKIQFVAHEGDFIFSKIDAKNGAFAIIPNELDKSIVTSDFPLFKVDQNKIDIEYLQCCLRYGEYGKKLTNFAKGTTNRRRVKIPDVMNLTVYTPSLNEQKEIVKEIKKMETVIEKANETITSTSEDIKDGFKNKCGINTA